MDPLGLDPPAGTPPKAAQEPTAITACAFFPSRSMWVVPSMPWPWLSPTSHMRGSAVITEPSTTRMKDFPSASYMASMAWSPAAAMTVGWKARLT